MPQEAHSQTKAARGDLAVAIAAVNSSLVISRRVQRRSALDSMLAALLQLQRANHLRQAVL